MNNVKLNTKYLLFDRNRHFPRVSALEQVSYLGSIYSLKIYIFDLSFK